MKYFIDIDDTICRPDKATNSSMGKYENAVPIQERINKVNSLFDEGHEITYWTARGNFSGIDKIYLEEFTRRQLLKWGCKFHELLMGKPSYDVYIDDKSFNVDSKWPLTSVACELCKKSTTDRVEKGWGHEVIIVNNELYCGKILHFNRGGKFSMHYHLNKKETWYVSTGLFRFRWINTKNADIIEESLKPGDTITNEVGEPHQLICLEEGDIFEVSTHHQDSDSYRVGKGDSQQC
jgi:mannose-6-phosphate isomerase-like protein (cupin superfamily)